MADSSAHRQERTEVWRVAPAVAALFLLACDAQAPRAPDIAIENGWAREIAPGQATAAVYLTIVNRGDGDDRLVDVESRAAAEAMLHSASSADGIARMRPIEGGLDIPARARVELKPAGTHIMLEGLDRPLRAGQTVDVELRFARSGRRSIAVRVVPAAAEHHPGHGMGQ